MFKQKRKERFPQLFSFDCQVTFFQKLAVGGSSGVLATSIVYPLDMVKTTMQVGMGRWHDE